ncbi:MAG: hypothetical protein RIR96_823 [Bacteroidota bacterium]|jgi:hypothetical protein
MLMIDPLFYLFISYQQKHAYDNRLQNAIDGKCNSEILILGSSRAARNIIAKQMEDSLHKKCFNLSYPGSNLDFHVFVLETYLQKNKKPETILLTMDDSLSLKQNESLNFRNDVLYPLAHLKYINDRLVENNENPFISKYMYTFRAEKSMFKITSQAIASTDTLWPCGSMPIVFTKPDYSFAYNPNDTTYSSVGEQAQLVESLKRIISICKKNNIRLVFVFPPNFKNHNPSFEKRIRNLASTEIPFMIHNQNEGRYKDSTYYYDMGHLTLRGARIFTNELVSYLRTSHHN